MREQWSWSRRVPEERSGLSWSTIGSPARNAYARQSAGWPNLHLGSDGLSVALVITLNDYLAGESIGWLAAYRLTVPAVTVSLSARRSVLLDGRVTVDNDKWIRDRLAD